jgi:hypothetical protein
MSSHSQWSPSGSKRWLACPGSVKFCSGRESSDTVYSLEGSFVHSLAERALLGGKFASAYVGTESYHTLAGVDHTFVFSNKDAAYLEKYLEFVRGLTVVSDGILMVEQKVKLKDAPDIRGTADAVIIADDGVHVIDLKWGQGVRVTAEANSQAIIYGLGVLDMIGEDRPLRLHIVQPRIDSITSCEMTVDEVKAARAEILAGYQKTLQEDAPLVAGDHCTFCPRKQDCPALHSQALKAAKDFFPTGEVTTMVEPPAVSSMTDAQIARVLTARGQIESWLSQVAAEGMARASRGQEITGFKVVEKVSNRKWVSDESAVAAMRGAGIDPFAPAKVVTPAEAERRVGNKKLAQQILGPLVTKEVTGLALVPTADKRPAVTNFSSFSFDALTDD